MNYYNDNNPHAAQWLRNLISMGLIPHGDVDDRSIRDVRPADLRGYTQCHFFAGIGGWPLALDLAGWPADRPVWTASCPCQPFSIAGKGLGEADERHLWPVVAELIGQCRPAILFGEQVASRDGREWLARVRTDLEALGYAVGAADLCAAGIAAPHMRQRLYFGAIGMGHGDNDGREAGRGTAAALGYGRPANANGGASGIRLADADGFGVQRPGEPGAMAGAASQAESQGRERERGGRAVRGCGSGSGRMGNADSGGCVGRKGYAEHDGEAPRRAQSERELEGASELARSRVGNAASSGLAGPAIVSGNASEESPAAKRASPWGDAEWLDGRDGKARRVKPGVPLLVDGLPRDVAGSLAGFGNAIVPPLAAEFIKAFADAIR